MFFVEAIRIVSILHRASLTLCPAQLSPLPLLLSGASTRDDNFLSMWWISILICDFSMFFQAYLLPTMQLSIQSGHTG